MSTSAWTPVDETAAQWTPVDETAAVGGFKIPAVGLQGQHAIVPAPPPITDAQRAAARNSLSDQYKAEILGQGAQLGKVASVLAPIATGGMSLPAQSAISAAAAAAQSKLGGGSNTEAGVSGAIGAAIPLGGTLASKAWQMLQEAGLAHDAVGALSPRAAHAWRIWNKVSAGLAKATAEEASPELTQAQALQRGAQPTVDPAAGLGKIPLRTEAPPPATPAEEFPVERPPLSPDIRPVHGESALRDILTRQDNTNLLKIAKGRGINVTKEALLKPGTADKLLINKIVDDFSPEELNDVGAQYLENMRFRHNFGDIGKEGWKTLSLQSYFPEMKIPAAQLKRTQLAIAKAIVNPQPVVASETDDLTDLLKKSVEMVKQGAH